MIRATEFRLMRIQASAFFQGAGVRPALVLKRMPKAWEDMYDADPVSLPLPADAPIEVPNVILLSKDDTQRAQISRARVDLIQSCDNAEHTDLVETLAVLAERLVQLQEVMNVRYGRLAAIAARVAPLDQPGLALAREFCTDRWLSGPLNRPEGFELHAHKTFALLGDVVVNSWMRIKAAKLGESEGFSRILVEQDINTLANELDTRRFEPDEIASWYHAAAEQLDTVLRLYFPATPETEEQPQQC
jgi:hypothetical protein